MGIKNAISRLMRTEDRVDGASEGGLDLNDLGFDGLNTNEWVTLGVEATNPESAESALPELPEGLGIPTDTDQPTGWITAEAGELAPLWYAIAREYPRTGAWPLAVRGDLEPWLGTDLVGWYHTNELGTEAFLRRTFDTAAQLGETESWRTTWRGLARGERTADPAQIRVQPLDGEFRLLLVRTGVPADALGVIGWNGAQGWEFNGSELSEVLYSWQQRFGAVLVGVAADSIRLSVERPPIDEKNCELLAREHYAFAPDILNDSERDITDYARELPHHKEWEFWWN